MAFRRYHYSHTHIVAAALIIGFGAGIVAFLSGSHQAARTNTTGLSLMPITNADLTARPDGYIVYPGAVVFRRTVHPEGTTQNTIDGPVEDPAYTATFMATQDSPDQVRTWYAERMSSEGYTCYHGVEADYMYQIDTYARGAREAFWIGYIDRRLLNFDTSTTIPTTRTIFEVDYLIRPAKDTNIKLPGGTCYLPFPTPLP